MFNWLWRTHDCSIGCQVLRVHALSLKNEWTNWTTTTIEHINQLDHSSLPALRSRYVLRTKNDVYMQWVNFATKASLRTHIEGYMQMCQLCNTWTNCTMGWLRLVGSLKWKISFAKEPYKRDCILQKRPMILRSLLSVATTYYHYNTLINVSMHWLFTPCNKRNIAYHVCI